MYQSEQEKCWLKNEQKTKANLSILTYRSPQEDGIMMVGAIN